MQHTQKVIAHCPLCLLYPPDAFKVWLKEEKGEPSHSAEKVNQYAEEFNNR